MRSRQYRTCSSAVSGLTVGIWTLWCLSHMQTCNSWEYSETHNGHAPTVTEWACVSTMTDKIALSLLLRTELTAEKERKQWCFNNYG